MTTAVSRTTKRAVKGKSFVKSLKHDVTNFYANLSELLKEAMGTSRSLLSSALGSTPHCYDQDLWIGSSFCFCCVPSYFMYTFPAYFCHELTKDFFMELNSLEL